MYHNLNTNFDILFVIHAGASWFHSDELKIDQTATMVPRREPINVTKVYQVS